MVATIKYIAGSRFAHDRKAIDRKAEQIEATVAALTDKGISSTKEIFFVIVVNESTKKSAIVDVRDDYDLAMKEAQLCFSAMHQINPGFRWGIRIDRTDVKSR